LILKHILKLDGDHQTVCR